MLCDAEACFAAEGSFATGFSSEPLGGDLFPLLAARGAAFVPNDL